MRSRGLEHDRVRSGESTDNSLVPVTLRFPGALALAAREIAVIGPFNGWNLGAHRLKKTAEGDWSITIYLPPGRLIYYFDVDGVAWLDPCDDGHIPNSWGAEYSVRDVSPTGEPSGSLRAPRVPRPAGEAVQESRFECMVVVGTDAVLMHPAGEVDAGTVSTLRTALKSAVETGLHIVVDLSKLRSIDSTGIKELLVHHSLSREHERELVLAAPQDGILEFMGRLGLAKVIPTFPSLEAALRSFHLREAS